MSYWIPSAILCFVLLVLIAQLPWRGPKRRENSQRRPLDFGDHLNYSGSSTPEETNHDTAALSKS
jgi:hypothetical protein